LRAEKVEITQRIDIGALVDLRIDGDDFTIGGRIVKCTNKFASIVVTEVNELVLH
jgi:hypothetical protein